MYFKSSLKNGTNNESENAYLNPVFLYKHAKYDMVIEIQLVRN